MPYTSATNTKILEFLNRAQTKIGLVSILVANKVSEDARYETYKDEVEIAYGLLSFCRSLDNNFNDWTEAEIIQFIDKWTAKANLNSVPYFEHSELNLNVQFEDASQAATQAEVNAGGETQKFVSPATLAAKALKTGTYSTELTFDTDKDIYQDVTSPTFTLAASGNINGVGIILRLNTPTSVNFPANFEAHANSATLDATKLNVYTLVYFSNWNGSGTARVIYMNSLFTAI